MPAPCSADRSDFAEQLDALLQRPEPPSQLTLEQLDDALGVGAPLLAAPGCRV